MIHFDVFNGDADGICALTQLRNAQPREAELITGVKRDINLLDTFPYDAVKRFYSAWYRPDFQAIIAVGDFDGKIIEQKIKEVN